MAHIVKCRICKQQFDTEKLLKMVLHMQMPVVLLASVSTSVPVKTADLSVGM